MSAAILPLAIWASGTNQNSIPANDNALRIEALSREIISQAVTAQPGSPADGDTYIIAATHTGAQWSTFSPKDIAIYRGGTWYAWAPTEGLIVNVAGSEYKYDGGAWTAVGGGGGSVAGSDKQIQYNNAGAFGAEAGFEYDLATNTLTVPKIDEGKGTDIASASTTDIGAATGNVVHVTGTTTITAFGTVAAGARRIVVFDGALTLTHNATSLILPTGANISTAAGDTLTAISEGSGNWRVTSYQRKDGSAVAGGGGLTNFTESVNTSGPNASIPVVKLLATNAASDVDAVLSPKGSGSILGNTPDNGSNGGNKRGVQAVDWQLHRYSNISVASGTRACIPGGDDNTASGTTSFAMGRTATSSAQSSSAIGENVTADGAFSESTGLNALVRGIYGAQAWASGSFSAEGDAQARRFVLRASTPDATLKVATTNQAAAGTTNQIVLGAQGVYKISGQVAAVNASTADAVGFDISAVVKRVSNTVSVVGTPTVTQQAADSGLSACAVTITADNTAASNLKCNT